MMSQVGLKLFQCIGFLPLSVLRAMGTMVGLTLYVGARWRRHVVLQNLRVCFPEKSESKRQEIAKQAFVYLPKLGLIGVGCGTAVRVVSKRACVLRVLLMNSKQMYPPLSSHRTLSD